MMRIADLTRSRIAPPDRAHPIPGRRSNSRRSVFKQVGPSTRASGVRWADTQALMKFAPRSAHPSRGECRGRAREGQSLLSVANRTDENVEITREKTHLHRLEPPVARRAPRGASIRL